MPVVYARRGQHPTPRDVSRYGTEPWRRLSPFFLHQPGVPIPGRFALTDWLDRERDTGFPPYSRSVEGIWQGLKLIEGQTDATLFQKAPKKRRGKPSGHEYANHTVGYREAKALIYIPAYLHVLRDLEPGLVQELRNQPEEVGIVDVSYQPDCLAEKPISHAKLLVDYLHGQLKPYEDAYQRLLAEARQLNDAYGDHVRSVPPLLEKTVEKRSKFGNSVVS